MRRRGALRVIIATLCVVLIAPFAMAQPGGFPWSRGDEVGSGWTLSALKRHPEFVRLTLERGDERAEVEVVPSGGPGPWSTEHYRVQPPPGIAAKPSALKVTRSALAAWEALDGHQPFVGKASAAEATPSAGPALPAWRVQRAQDGPPEGRGYWALLWGVMLALLSACLARARRPGRALGGLALSLGVGCVVGFGVSPSALPTAWITVLHEGAVSHIIGSLHGEGHHGPALDALRWWFDTGEGSGLRALVHLNLTLSAMNTLALGWLCWTLTGHRSLALLTAAAWGLCPLQVNLAWSDLPAALLTTHVLVGAVALQMVSRTPRLAMALLALSALGLGGVRLEWGVLGLLTWGSMILCLLLPDALKARLDRPWLSLGALLIGALVISFMGQLGEGTMVSAPEAWTLWQKSSGGAVGFGILSWPLGLLATWPLGLTLLATLGLWALLKRPLSASAAGIGLLLLQGVYWTSAHGGDAPYEVLRYAALMSGLAGVLVLIGWRTLLAWCEGRTRGKALWLSVAALCLVPLPDGLFRMGLETHHAESPGPLYDMPLTRHVQAEARSLMALSEAHPECVIATVSAVEPGGDRQVSAYEYVFFGGSLMAPQVCDRVPGAFGEIARAALSEGECLLFHRGLDCHIRGGPDCREEVAGAELIGGVERPERPYYDHVLRRAPLRLEVWRHRGRR